MKLLGKDEFLSAEDRPYEDIPLPEFGEGVGVRVRTMSGSERDDWESALTVTEQDGVDEQGKPRMRVRYNLKNVRARLVALSVVDEKGNRLFTTDEDVEAVGRKSFAALDRITAAARRLNRLGSGDLEAEVKKSLPGAS